MKKIITVAALALCVVGAAHAQTAYDAAKLADKDLNGTARFVGMGGAMGALGGDLSTIGTNPAGIGIYRSNDVMTSFSMSAYGVESNYGGKTFNNDKNRWSYDNIGFVFSTKIGNQTPLRYVNFGFNYKRSKSFYKNMSMEGFMNQAMNGRTFSQNIQMAQQANDAADYVFDNYGQHLDFGGKDIFEDSEAGWLGALGWNGFLLNQGEDLIYSPISGDEVYAKYRSKESGGINQYDFNVAFNINDRVYFGVTVGTYDVDYSKYTMYDENYGTGAGYNLQSWNKISGSGFDLKFGAIIRPFENSPFRFGLAIHTPTFYKLSLATSARLESDVFLGNDESTTAKDIDTQELLDGDMHRDFRLQTPWLYNVSLGYTVGSSLALGAEYEYEDYSSMRFRYPGFDGGGNMVDETSGVKNSLKGVSTFRIGAEYKVIPQFALRLGYNYSSAAFKNNAVKILPSNSVNVDTDFSNSKSRSNYTLGIGYRRSMFYADLAYQFSTYKEDFYPFYNEFNDSKTGKWSLETPDATQVKNTRSQVLVTLGMRF